MKWHTYAITPIDLCWDSLSTVQETAARLGAESAKARAAGESDYPYDGPDIDGFLADWLSAQEAASEAGWEGDFRNEPVVFWVPSETNFAYGFVIKHDNNGDTFVMSPVPLPHLDRIKFN